MNPTTTKPEIFTTWSDAIKNRLDPRFYLPHFTEFEKLLSDRKDTKTLGEIAEYIGSGATPLSGGEAYITKEDGGIPFVRVTDLKDGQINLTDVLYIKPEIHNGMLKRTQLKVGDILLSMAGTIGLVAIVQDDIGEANINQALARIVLKKGYNNKYVAAVLSSKIGEKQTDRLARPSVQANINLDEIRSIKIPVPSEKIQDEVVQKIKTAYAEKHKKEEEIKKILASIDDFVLGELGIEVPEGGAEQVYEIWSDEILGGRLDPEYYNPRFKLFYSALSKAKYDVVSLGQVAKAVFQGIGKDETENPAITLLKVKNITKNGEIDYTDTEFVQDAPENKLLQKGDIVSPFIGEAVRQCKFAIFDRDDAAFAVDNNTGVIRADNEKAESRYVAEVLNSSVGKIQLEQLVGGGGVPFLGAANAAKLQIPLPPLKTQKQIAEKVLAFREQIKALHAQVAEVLTDAQRQVEQMILA